MPLMNILILVFFSLSYVSSTPHKLSLRLSFAQSRIILRNEDRVSATLNKSTNQCDIYQATKLTTCNFSPLNILLLASMTRIVAAWSIEMWCFSASNCVATTYFLPKISPSNGPLRYIFRLY